MDISEAKRDQDAAVWRLVSDVSAALDEYLALWQRATKQVEKGVDESREDNVPSRSER